MAHPCINCGTECYCNGDIDDVIVCHMPVNCTGCGCEDSDGEPEFQECPKCDGHPACEDFGCAYEQGLGHMVKRDFESSDL